MHLSNTKLMFIILLSQMIYADKNVKRIND